MQRTLLIIIVAVGLFLTSCERESAFPLSPPSVINASGGPNQVTQEPGNSILLEIIFQAASGLDRFEVLRDGQVYHKMSFDNGEISYDYNFAYEIPADNELGQQSDFTFRIFDQEGRQASFDYAVLVDVTFSEFEEEVNGTTVTRVSGRSNSDYTFEAGRTYMIDSIFSIEDNSVLTIEAGSTVYFKTYEDPNMISRLMVSRGSRLEAEGTPEAPIVFTSDKVLMDQEPQPDDWGGISIYGSAPTNEGENVLDDGFRYGGNIPNSSSGSLTYARIEYAGKNGTHALRLLGVGSNTLIEHVQVYRNENIAFRMNGGRVHLKYIAAIGHGGYGVWGDHGWQGNGQFWICQTDVSATLVPVNFWNQARSLEMRSDEDFFLNEPRTNFNISNLTLIGNGFTSGKDMGTRRGVRIRRGAYGILQNLIVSEFPNDGVRIEDLDINELGDSMVLGNTRSYNNQENYEQDAPIFEEDPGFNVSTGSVPGISTSSFSGSEVSTFNPETLGNWFTNAPYIGAIENEQNDWTSQGEWFKNLDGSIR